MSDFRYTLRAFRNQPAFFAIAVVLIALGIGASGVIFSAFDALLLRNLSVREPDRLYELTQTLPQLGRRSAMSGDVYRAMRDRATLLTDVIVETYRDLALTEPGPAEQVRVNFVSPNFFASLGVDARMGRVLAVGDVNAAVISSGFFERRFSADPRVIGQKIAIRGYPLTIVGVLPKEFSGFSIDTAPDVRVPLAAWSAVTGEKAESYFFDIAARLRPGVSVSQAAAEANAIWRAAMLAGEDPVPEWRIAKGIELTPLQHGVSRLRDGFSSALMFLGAAVGVLMLIVCANVAGLLLTRGAQREAEIAMRIALGASRWRLIRQVLSESLLLALFGCVLGIAIAYSAAPLLVRALPPVRDFTASYPVALEIRPNARVLALSAFSAMLIAILSGLAPALRFSRVELRSNRVARGWRGRRALVVGEIALCTVLLAAAGLLVRTFESLRTMDPGFDRDHVVTFTINPGLSGYTLEQRMIFSNTLIDRVRSIPSVRSVSIAALGVMRGSGMKTTIARTGEKATADNFLNASLNFIALGYFETMGMQIVAGRSLTAADKSLPARTPVVVNRAFATYFFPNQDPLGKTFGSGANTVAKDTFQIVGVATDAHYRSLREAIPATIYAPGLQDYNGPFILHIRTATRPEEIIAPVREMIRALDPQLPIIETHTLAEELESTLWSERLVAALASIFGLLAAILAAIGIYGLLAFRVAQRTREIGIRVALGAAPSRVLALIGGQSAILAGTGVLIGVVTALLVLPLARTLLYGVAPHDPATLAATAAFVAAIAAIATAIPAVRALRVDPAGALRQD